jgi:hypothetical protein
VPIKTYRAVKTLAQYNKTVRVLTYWGDDEFLATAEDDDPDVSEIRRFRKMNENVGYNYGAHFKLLHTENSEHSEDCPAAQEVKWYCPPYVGHL